MAIGMHARGSSQDGREPGAERQAIKARAVLHAGNTFGAVVAEGLTREHPRMAPVPLQNAEWHLRLAAPLVPLPLADIAPPDIQHGQTGGLAKRHAGAAHSPIDGRRDAPYSCYMQLPTRKAAHGADPLLDDAQALNAAVAELVRVYQFRDRDKICCYDISVTQCYALEALVERGPMRSQELARSLMLDKSTTTRVVDALERKDYVERQSDSTDARALSLRVTRSGRALYEKINRELIAQHAQLLEDLSPEIRSGVTQVIRRLAQAAQARFVAGVSVGSCGTSCGPSCS